LWEHRVEQFGVEHGDGEEFCDERERVDAEAEPEDAQRRVAARGGEDRVERPAGVVDRPAVAVVVLKVAEQFLAELAHDRAPQVEVIGLVEGRIGGGLEGADGGDLVEAAAAGDLGRVVPVQQALGRVRAGAPEVRKLIAGITGRRARLVGSPIDARNGS
jgi:hypothetical protein